MTLSVWIGCEVEELMREARALNDGIGPDEPTNEARAA